MAETIFLSHAAPSSGIEGQEGGVISAGTQFQNACKSLASAYPKLRALENEAMEAWVSPARRSPPGGSVRPGLDQPLVQR